MPQVGGAGENAITNTFAFGDFATGDEVPLTAALKGFYDSIPNNDLSIQLSQGPYTVKWYLKPGVKPNYPFATTTFTRTSMPAGDPLPSEVCVCLSFQGLKAAGAPQARRRGRIYIGTLGVNANQLGMVKPAFITAVTAGAAAFKTAVTAVPSPVYWAIWSVTEEQAVPVLNGWVDNAFDIQRRRGVDPTTRTTFV